MSKPRNSQHRVAASAVVVMFVVRFALSASPVATNGSPCSDGLTVPVSPEPAHPASEPRPQTVR